MTPCNSPLLALSATEPSASAKAQFKYCKKLTLLNAWHLSGPTRWWRSPAATSPTNYGCPASSRPTREPTSAASSTSVAACPSTTAPTPTSTWSHTDRVWEPPAGTRAPGLSRPPGPRRQAATRMPTPGTRRLGRSWRGKRTVLVVVSLAVERTVRCCELVRWRARYRERESACYRCFHYKGCISFKTSRGTRPFVFI